MQLERVKIQNYKCLRNVDVRFRQPGGGTSPLSAHFLVGANGSGKSCFLEALGLIFTCVMQGESPGFPFVLEYRVRRGAVRVRGVRGGAGEKLEVTIKGEKVPHGRVPEDCLPRRIVAFSSGANHLMDSVLMSSPWMSLASSLYDLARQGGGMEAERLMEQYRTRDTNPRVFSVDGATARLIVPVLFAVVPGFEDPLLAESYFRLRDELLRRTGGGLVPAAFSITVDETRLQNVIEERRNSPQYGLLARLFRTGQQGGPLHSWMVRRPMLPAAEAFGGEDGSQMSQTAVFAYEPWPGAEKEGWFWSSGLSREFSGDPMLLLNVLLVAHRGNILRDIQLAFRAGDRPGLLGLETLSDGELMWLARMGLVLMSRLSGSAETLFLFDEPDVHFNNEWNMDFVKTLRLCSETPKEGLEHEFVIATHSTLLLTDAYAEQINLFSAGGKEGVRVEPAPVSTFAAQQDELARLLFSASAIGSYAKQRVDGLLNEARTPEEVLELIRQTGPGYQRFRLYERYHELRSQREDGP